MSSAAEQAERAAPGDPADALVWEDLEQSAGEETRLSVTYLAFMVVATIIASVGVMLDQPILIVGAMVVGPEFGPLVALCVGIVSREPRQAAEAVGTLALGFAVGITATIVATWALDAIGLIEESMLTGERPLTSFIWQPDALSWIVGFLAGIAGMLSLTSEKVRRVGGGADLGHHHSGRRERRGRAGVLGVGGSSRLADPAWPQRVGDRGRRSADPGRSEGAPGPAWPSRRSAG